jgi:hypothetical protein
MRNRRADRKPSSSCERVSSAKNHVGSTTPYVVTMSGRLSKPVQRYQA